jgi:hypothetical protein
VSGDQGRAAQSATAQRRAAEPADYSGELPGDPACLLRRVCLACGAVSDTDPPTVCARCGAELSGT